MLQPPLLLSFLLVAGYIAGGTTFWWQRAVARSQLNSNTEVNLLILINVDARRERSNSLWVDQPKSACLNSRLSALIRLF